MLSNVFYVLIGICLYLYLLYLLACIVCNGLCWYALACNGTLGCNGTEDGVTVEGRSGHGLRADEARSATKERPPF